MSADPEFDAGEIVHDRDDEDPNEAVVVNTPPITAAEWEVRPRGTTLAEDNPTYPEEAAVVIVVFRETLDDYFDRGAVDTPTDGLDSAIPIGQLAEEKVSFYAFPEPRLDPIEEQYEHDRASNSDPSGNKATVDSEAKTSDEGPDSGAVDALEERLANSGMRVVDRDKEGTLTVAKMRDTYRVRPGQVIEGDGRFRQRLEQLVTGDGDGSGE